MCVDKEIFSTMPGEQLWTRRMRRMVSGASCGSEPAAERCFSGSRWSGFLRLLAADVFLTARGPLAGRAARCSGACWPGMGRGARVCCGPPGVCQFVLLWFSWLCLLFASFDEFGVG
jgi:hypothetical protein